MQGKARQGKAKQGNARQGRGPSSRQAAYLAAAELKGEVASGEIGLRVIEVEAVLNCFSTIVNEEARSLVKARVDDLATRGRERGGRSFYGYRFYTRTGLIVHMTAYLKLRV